MKNSDILDAVNEAEATFPVDTWSVGGVRVWPIVRIRWALDAFAACHTTAREPVLRHSLVARGALTAGGILRRYLRARVADRGREASSRKPVDAVLLSDGLSYLKVGGRAYERFCDPLIERLTARGRRSLLLNPLRLFPCPRHSPSYQVQPQLDALRIGTALLGHLPLGGVKVELDGYEAAADFLATRGPLRPLSRGQVVHYARVVETWAAWFDRALRRTRPRAAFVVAYYSLIGFAFARACRRLGIPCADLQHGVAGELHPAYGRWHRVPADGYDLLPSCFWCWSEEDKAAIDAWCGSVSDWHQAVVGGNLMLEQWRAGAEGGAMAPYDERVRRMLRPGALHVLLTLQPGLAGPAALAPLLKAVPRLPERVRFWVRLHPVMNEGAEAVRGLFPAGRTEIEDSSILPLYALLRHADLHVTHSSSTVVESARFGVSSLVLSRYGLELFPTEVREGFAVLADDPVAVERAIASAPPPARERSSRDAAQALGRSYALLDSLVG